MAALVATATATAIGRGSGTEEISATFQARTIGDPSIKSCRAIPGGTYSQFQADYPDPFNSLTTDAGEEFVFNLRGVEILVNEEAGLGAAESHWTLTSRDGAQRGSGEMIAVFIGNPNIFEGDLHGMLIGGVEDPDERSVLWNFSARLSDGGRTLTGAIGDPNVAPNPAILIPPGPC
jgi:hypothetical protein